MVWYIYNISHYAPRARVSIYAWGRVGRELDAPMNRKRPLTIDPIYPYIIYLIILIHRYRIFLYPNPYYYYPFIPNIPVPPG